MDERQCEILSLCLKLKERGRVRFIFKTGLS